VDIYRRVQIANRQWTFEIYGSWRHFHFLSEDRHCLCDALLDWWPVESWSDCMSSFVRAYFGTCLVMFMLDVPYKNEL